MSLTFKFRLLFYIIFLQTWRIILPASVYYGDYNNPDNTDTDTNDYFDYNQQSRNSMSGERYFNQPNSYQVNCATQCMPVKLSTTAKTTTTFAPVSTAEVENIIEHIVTIIKSMRAHAISLIRNINVLEADLLPSSSSSSSSANDDGIYKNCDRMKKILYPDVLYQTPGNLINEWLIPVKSDVLSEAPQTNEFVEEAQEAVKSWKEQIENCKRMLDNAVHNALIKSNLKNDFNDPFVRKSKKPFKATHYNTNDNYKNSKLSTEVKEQQNELENENLQKLANNKIRKYYSIYDALRTKANNT